LQQGIYSIARGPSLDEVAPLRDLAAKPEGAPPASTAIGGVASGPAASGPSTIATPTATPDQEAIRKATAKAYLAAVGPTNKAYETLATQYKNVTALKPNKMYCAKLAAADHAELVALQAIDWPKDTAADAKALTRNGAAQEAEERTCAKAATVSEWNQAWNLAGKANDRAHEAANLVRLDLKLPPVPG
jgi:hypothetical protein